MTNCLSKASFCHLGNQTENRYQNEAWKTLKAFGTFGFAKVHINKEEMMKECFKINELLKKTSSLDRMNEIAFSTFFISIKNILIIIICDVDLP
jgi:hypothetical protein